MPKYSYFIIALAGFMVFNCSRIAGQFQSQHYFMAGGKNMDIDIFDKEVEKTMDEIGIPGMSLAIIDNNRIVYTQGYGVRQGDEKVNRKTVFSGGSLSKNFLAFVVYQLVDEGKLDLDRPMYQYLEHEGLKHDARYKQITSRMVMSHSSGLENWSWDNNIDSLEIIYDPGKKFIYSGEGYQYLARVVGTILGQSYETYIHDRVISSLKMRNVVFKFEQRRRKTFPWNYSHGHSTLGDEISYYEYSYAIPAAGNLFDAEDYAKLILGIFDTAYVSAERRRDIYQPIVRLNNSVFYGAGFEVVQNEYDTIIAHGGDNMGHKNYCFYSPVSKKGFIYMTNSDRGFLILSRLNEMTVRLNLDPFLKSPFLAEQYPSAALQVLKKYDEGGYSKMISEFGALKKENKVTLNTLNVLGGFFFGQEGVASRFFRESIALKPDSPLAYAQLGRLYLNKLSYDSALYYLTLASQLNFSGWHIDEAIKKCRNELADKQRRKSFQVSISKKAETVIKGESYNSMGGIRLGRSSDGGGGRVVGWTDAGDWADYRIDVPSSGTYWVAMRVSSPEGGGPVELRLGGDMLATFDISPTKGWENWTTLSKRVDLPEGNYMLRVYFVSGGLNVNWLKFSWLSAPDQSKQ